MTPRVAPATPHTHANALSLREASRFWFRLGWVSFGGPAGQIALLHRELVERRRWLSERRYLHALNYCMLLPGPEATQLATYLPLVVIGARPLALPMAPPPAADRSRIQLPRRRPCTTTTPPRPSTPAARAGAWPSPF